MYSKEGSPKSLCFLNPLFLGDRFFLHLLALGRELAQVLGLVDVLGSLGRHDDGTDTSGVMLPLLRPFDLIGVLVLKEPNPLDKFSGCRFPLAFLERKMKPGGKPKPGLLPVRQFPAGSDVSGVRADSFWASL